MRQQLVYDLPTRLFHVLFVGLFLTAFAIGKWVDDDSVIYSYHMLAGLTLGFLVLLRIVWGFVGTKHARFSGFALKPSELVGYIKGLLAGAKTKWAGHNPASSWAALTMMAFVVGLGVTGFLMASDGANKETFEEIHELLGNGLAVVAILHVAGVVLHMLRHKDGIAFSMFDGKKSEVAVGDTISSQRTAFGALLIAFVVAFGLHLFNNFDSQNGTLQFFGTTLHLSEIEDGSKDVNADYSEGGDDSHDDDNDDE